MQESSIKNIIEAALFAAGRPLKIEQIIQLFDEDDKPAKITVKDLLDEISQEYIQRGIEIKQVASGYRVQVKSDYAHWIAKLWEEKPAKYTRALLETLAIIAYRQPITRGEIEEIRGVAVSSSIVKTLQEREWVRIVGHRDVPGKPAMLGTTRTFLDYFGLQTLDEMPTLAELKDIDDIGALLEQKLARSANKSNVDLVVMDGGQAKGDSNNQHSAPHLTLVNSEN
jgi:segregation and condensation protein B